MDGEDVCFDRLLLLVEDDPPSEPVVVVLRPDLGEGVATSDPTSGVALFEGAPDLDNPIPRRFRLADEGVDGAVEEEEEEAVSVPCLDAAAVPVAEGILGLVVGPDFGTEVLAVSGPVWLDVSLCFRFVLDGLTAGVLTEGSASVPNEADWAGLSG